MHLENKQNHSQKVFDGIILETHLSAENITCFFFNSFDVALTMIRPGLPLQMEVFLFYRVQGYKINTVFQHRQTC